MSIGLHAVHVYPDPAAGGWSAPIASNPSLATDLAGWRANPFQADWTWVSGGAEASGAKEFDRDPAYPVPRPAGATRLRCRWQFTTSLAGPIFYGLYFGTTASAAWGGPFWNPDTAIQRFGAIHSSEPPGTRSVEFVTDLTTVPAGYGFVGPFLKLPAGENRIEYCELTYLGAAGIDISCLVDEVAINHGRDDAQGQPDASSATINLTCDPIDNPLPADVEVGNVLVVTTATAEQTSTRFVGRITDISLGWDDVGEDTPDAGVGQIVATGYLADLGRRVVGATPWPQELDGARVSRVMTAAGVTLDPFWSDPGTVQIIARDVDSQPALDVAHDAAQSASGILWATRGGEIRYADANHRKGATPAISLDACDLLVTPTWRRSTVGLVNEVSIGYGVAPEGGDQPRYEASSASSAATYGRYGITATTSLAAAGDAQALAESMLARSSRPYWDMAALPIDLAGLDAQRYDQVLSLDMHDLITLTGLPSIGAAPTAVALWVEGWREHLTWDAHQIELAVTGYCRTAPSPRWNDMAPDMTWDTVKPGDLTWDGAYCIGPPVDYGRWDDQSASQRWDTVPASTTWDNFGSAT